MSEFTVFAFDSAAVRMIVKGDEPWFVATDVATILGYIEARDMVRMLDEDEKGRHLVPTLGGTQELWIVSESGLYAAILKSKKPEAKRFRKWVTSEVLPTLRKTGRYIDPSFRPESRAEAAMHSIDADQFVTARRIFCSSVTAARKSRLQLADALEVANQVTARRTGVDLLAELDADDHIARLRRDGGGAFGDPDLPMHLQRFWEAFTGGEIDARLPAPLLRPQFQRLYRRWCEQNGYTPLGGRRPLNALRDAGMLGEAREYYVDADKRLMYLSDFAFPGDDTPEYRQLRDPLWMGRCVIVGDAVLADLEPPDAER